jgi:hypothetical protein
MKALREGQRFERLTVVKRSEPRPGIDGPYIYYDCVCICGNAVPHCRSDTLRNGHTRSCGCLRRDLTIEHHANKTAK